MKNAIRIYVLLIRLYPRSYQSRFGAQILQTFIDHYQDVGAAEGAQRVQFWLALIADEIPNIVQQNLSALLEHNAFLKFTISKLLLAAIFFIPLYLLIYALLVNVVLALPHAHVHGIMALMALTFLLLCPAAISMVVSYILASAFVSLLRKRKVHVS